MKKIVLVAAAFLLTANSGVFAGTHSAKKAVKVNTCCTGGTCCKQGNACCK